MKELDHKDAPGISGGQLPVDGEPIPVTIGPMPFNPSIPTPPGMPAPMPERRQEV